MNSYDSNNKLYEKVEYEYSGDKISKETRYSIDSLENKTIYSYTTYEYSSFYLKKKYVSVQSSSNYQYIQEYFFADKGYAYMCIDNSSSSNFTSTDTTFYFYDSNGYLIELNNGTDDKTVYEIVNGNTANANYYNKIDSAGISNWIFSGKIIYTYDNNINPFSSFSISLSEDGLVFGNNNFIGTKNRNFLTKMEYFDNGQTYSTDTYDFFYELDPLGNITKMKYTYYYNNQTYSETMEFIYEN